MMRAKNTARSRQTRTGDATERLLQSCINAARSIQAAYITKRATPVRIASVDAKGRVTGWLERSPGVDYHGVLRDGRAVYFEAKTCSRGTFPLSAIEPTQWREMETLRGFGAVTALVVFWQPDTAKARALIGGRSWSWVVVPWSTLTRADIDSAPSLSCEQLASFAIGQGENPVASLWRKEFCR